MSEYSETRFMSVWVKVFWKMSFGTNLIKKKKCYVVQSFLISELKIRVCEPLPNSFGGCSVTQSCLNLWPQGLQHARLPYPSPSPGAFSNSCPLSWWCHPTMSSFFTHFSSCPQSFPTSGSFPMIPLFASGGQIIGVSALASVVLINIQEWFPLGLIGLISLLYKGLSRVFCKTTVRKHQFFSHSAFFMVQPSHPYMTNRIIIALTIWMFVDR